jgi:hypothetical protein
MYSDEKIDVIDIRTGEVSSMLVRMPKRELMELKAAHAFISKPEYTSTSTFGKQPPYFDFQNQQREYSICVAFNIVQSTTREFDHDG